MCFIWLDEILGFLFSLDSKNLMVTKPGPYLTGRLDPSIASPSAGFRCYPQPQVLPSSVSQIPSLVACTASACGTSSFLSASCSQIAPHLLQRALRVALSFLSIARPISSAVVRQCSTTVLAPSVHASATCSSRCLRSPPRLLLVHRPPLSPANGIRGRETTRRKEQEYTSERKKISLIEIPAPANRILAASHGYTARFREILGATASPRDRPSLLSRLPGQKRQRQR